MRENYYLGVDSSVEHACARLALPARVLCKSFLDELGNPYKKIIVDKNGTNSIEWGAFGVPETFIIYNNKIIKKYIGPLNNELLIEIQKIIK